MKREIKQNHLDQLKLEIAHIFDSGANEIRVYEMVKTFISKRDGDMFADDCTNEHYKSLYKKALQALVKYEDIEADIIIDNEAWGEDGMASAPTFTNQTWDQFIKCQAIRNKVVEEGREKGVIPEATQVVL